MTDAACKIVPGILLAAAILFLPAPGPQSQPVERVFQVEASRFSYSPAVLRVNPGDQVTLELMASDVVHGIYIDSYGLEASADPGQTARITFIADRPGLFRFRCLVPCGQLHPFMLGKLQVGSNELFARAGLLLGLGILMGFLWNRPLKFGKE
jgi:heme/copper-type cytochrome/quinol oxidase subunit 2